MKIQTFSRRDTSLLGRWWWTVDRWSLGAILIIMLIGVLLSFAASPPVAERLNLGTFFFVKRHIMMLPPAIMVMFLISLASPQQIRRLSFFLYVFCVVLLIITLTHGSEIKGARRWINLAGFSLQASELAKPVFAVLVAWMLAEKYRDINFPGFLLSLAFLGVLILLLLMQPDLGMTVVIVFTWMVQFFIAGMPILWIVVLAGTGITGLLGAYLFLPHVTRRINQFLDPQSGDPRHDLYQINQSLEAFMNGGLLGRGPGEGVVKRNVPDAHADFVFSVAGEEFGLILCVVLVALFAFVVIRSLLLSMNDTSLFVIMATAGIALQFGLQAFINMASALHLIPTKGMTMPFISYGGSSLVALGIAMGMLLALTKKRHGITELL